MPPGGRGRGRSGCRPTPRPSPATTTSGPPCSSPPCTDRCQRLVLASSMVVYGDGRYRCERARDGGRRRRGLDRTSRQGRSTTGAPSAGSRLTWALVDEDAPLRPRSLYAASKLAQENFALAWSLGTGGSVTALRYHNVYGDGMPRDTPYSGVAAMFRSSLEAGEPPRSTRTVGRPGISSTSGTWPRPMCDRWSGSCAGFTPLNVWSGHPVTIGEVARLLSRRPAGPTAGR